MPLKSGDYNSENSEKIDQGGCPGKLLLPVELFAL